MKSLRWLIISLVAVVALLLCAGGCIPGANQGWSIPTQVPPETQQGTGQITGIWVSGQGEVMAVPDLAELRLGVEAREDTVDEAIAQASEAMNKVMDALKANDVAEKDIQTQRFSIYPLTQWVERKEKEEIIGYRVTNMLVAKIRDIDKVGAVIDAAAKAGGDLTRIQGISFTIDDPTPYYKEARVEAVKDAKSKAQQLADSAGVKLGDPTYISEGTTYRSPPVMEYAKGGGAPSPETPISPGELEIVVNVQIAYALA